MEPDRTDPPEVCAHLRSRGTPGILYAERVDFDMGYVPTATFWCTDTADAVGPDDSYVHPHVCTGRRLCFTPD